MGIAAGGLQLIGNIEVFESEISLPHAALTDRESSLLGFEERYERIRSQLELLLKLDDLEAWNKTHHKGALLLAELVAEQHPLVVFHGDVGTGKSAMAECLANRIIAESGAEDCKLYKLSNRVRGDGKVGMMGTLLSGAISKVGGSAGKRRHAILIIDEGDSLAATRSSDNMHHEDKVAVNTLIQGIDQLRQYGGRVLAILCTNRVNVLDPAIQRRAAVIEEFKRPSPEERRKLFEMDLGALSLSESQFDKLVEATGANSDQPDWTYSDIRTRLYPAAIARAFPDRPLSFDDLHEATQHLSPSPSVEDR